MNRLSRSYFAAVAAAMVGCTSELDDRIQRCAKAPHIAVSADGERSTTLSVLTYNVEGLPWPARKDRRAQLRQIALELAVLRRSDRAPDVVLLQEAFSRPAVSIAPRSNYANWVGGPRAGSKRPPTTPDAPADLTDTRRLSKGEGFMQLTSSGLYILSDYPIIDFNRQPFRSRECAGYDCLANKGVVHARIAIPGVPRPIDVFNTHLQSRGHAGVPRDRSRAAHHLQVREVTRLIARWRESDNPLIFGGDFNMRNSPNRFGRFQQLTGWSIAHEYCARDGGTCDMHVSWDGDEPWLDTQDLQGFDDSPLVSVRPVRIEAMFDAPWHGQPLADHDGLLVLYRLSWRASADQDGCNPLNGSAAR